MRFVHSVALVLALVACDKSKSSGEGSAAPAVPRPAEISEEVAATLDAYIVAFEKITSDIEKVHGDCKAALAVVRADQSTFTVLAPRLEKLGPAMEAVKDTDAAEEWIRATFEKRMRTAAEKLRSLEPCKDDQELHAAINDVLTHMPFVRKKKH